MPLYASVDNLCFLISFVTCLSCTKLIGFLMLYKHSNSTWYSQSFVLSTILSLRTNSCSWAIQCISYACSFDSWLLPSSILCWKWWSFEPHLKHAPPCLVGRLHLVARWPNLSQLKQRIFSPVAGFPVGLAFSPCSSVVCSLLTGFRRFCSLWRSLVG